MCSECSKLETRLAQEARWERGLMCRGVDMCLEEQVKCFEEQVDLHYWTENVFFLDREHWWNSNWLISQQPYVFYPPNLVVLCDSPRSNNVSIWKRIHEAVPEQVKETCFFLTRTRPPLKQWSVDISTTARVLPPKLCSYMRVSEIRLFLKFEGNQWSSSREILRKVFPYDRDRRQNNERSKYQPQQAFYPKLCSPMRKPKS